MYVYIYTYINIYMSIQRRTTHWRCSAAQHRYLYSQRWQAWKDSFPHTIFLLPLVANKGIDGTVRRGTGTYVQKRQSWKDFCPSTIFFLPLVADNDALTAQCGQHTHIFFCRSERQRYICVYTNRYIYIYVHISLSLSPVYSQERERDTYICVCIFVCMCIYIYTYTYIYIHITCNTWKDSFPPRISLLSWQLVAQSFVTLLLNT